jgi:TDG/mug DNA glycosylase family protein
MIPPDARAVPDVIGPGLRVLFVGINPGLVSGATGHHFARPGNRFWPTLFGAGLTPRLLRPDEGETLLQLGIGITNLVARTTATAAELSDDELRAGGERLQMIVERYAPKAVAIVGKGAYQIAFGRPRVEIGLQPEGLGGSELWVLPNPSGLNAHYQLPQLIEVYANLRDRLR